MNLSGLHTQNEVLFPAPFLVFFNLLCAEMPCQRAKIEITQNKGMKNGQFAQLIQVGSETT